jgi:hypothetical protein
MFSMFAEEGWRRLLAGLGGHRRRPRRPVTGVLQSSPDAPGPEPGSLPVGVRYLSKFFRGGRQARRRSSLAAEREIPSPSFGQVTLFRHVNLWNALSFDKNVLALSISLRSHQFVINPRSGGA